MKFNWLVVVVILILVLGGGYIWFAKSKSNVASTKNLYAKDVPLMGRTHVKMGEKIKYNSNPPTSGEHFSEWTKSGIYDKPSDDGYQVHSLEHGYVIISYNCGIQNQKSNIKDQKEGTKSAEMDKSCLTFVDKLKDLVKADSWKMILMVRPSLDTDFALTAWGKIDKFNSKDATLDRVKAFIEAFRNRGPEQTME